MTTDAMSVTMKKIRNAGIDANAHFTMNDTMLEKGISMSTIRTGDPRSAFNTDSAVPVDAPRDAARGMGVRQSTFHAWEHIPRDSPWRHRPVVVSTCRLGWPSATSTPELLVFGHLSPGVP